MAHRLLRTRCTDPLSGFFVFRRASLQGITITGLGHKPLLEILSQKDVTIFEVPYVFRNRANGRSKLGGRTILEYLLLTGELARGGNRAGPSQRIVGESVPAPRGP